MNIIIKPDTLLNTPNYLHQVIYFLETKNNNIMTGEFTKLIFTDENMSLNGLYLNTDIIIDIPNHKMHDSKQKQTVMFQGNLSQNKTVVRQLIQLEHKLLDLYIQYKPCNKRAKYILQPQLMNGTLQLYSDPSCLNHPKIIVLKISGIWETDIAYGITYKFIEM